MRQYSILADFYDKLNSDFDYGGYARMADRLFRMNGIVPGDLVLDLACGTGNLTVRLSELGYNMIGADVSPEMLGVAREKAGDEILFINQDMRSFELYGTVKAVVCSLDSVNYLLKRKDLLDCFSAVHNYLEPDGLFIFDVNTKYRFENVYSDRDYILEDDGIFCGWRNVYNGKTGVCDFFLTLFAEENGEIKRFDEHQRERAWSERTLRNVLEQTGLAVTGIYSDFDLSPVGERDEKMFFVCRCRK
ncbi:MAG: class I SAM-dependent methyltransferase [Clostridia bacterium]|nr:class I SAM-dependent methyltransferase [Clostridia bacterium]